MADSLGEELEAVRSIFSEELSVHEGDDGSKLVQYKSKGDLVLTVQLNATYPDAVPVMVLADHLSTVGLWEHLHDSIKDLVGSPMLFQLFTATSEWIEGHPFSVNAATPPPVTVQEKLPSEASNSVCKFFKKGNCKFGSECRNYHPDPKGSLSKQPCSESKSPVADSTTGHSESRDPDTNEAQSGHSSKEIDLDHSSQQESDLRHDSSVRQNAKKQPMRTATDVISRILWDLDINTAEFTVGYLDRFVGVIEKPFTAFSWEDLASVGINVLAVPKHRIQYFKYRQEVVWDKTMQLDNVFGSRGGRVIQDVVEAHAAGNSSSAEPGKESEIDSRVESMGASKKITQEDRPTHFICIRVTGEEIRSCVQHVQDHIVNHSPHLAEGCLPSTALHVSVCMVHLETSAHLETAKTVLENTKKNFTQFLPSCAEIAFSGVDNFHDRLIYAKVLPDAGLAKFSSFLIERFRKAGLRTPGNHTKFTPHMTLVKMSRPMQHALHTTIINHEAYSQFQDTYIGKQHVDGIYLCSMVEPKQDDGFYKWLHFVSNSLLSLSPLLPAILVKCMHRLQQAGAVSLTRSAEFIETTTGSVDAAKFDHSVETIRQLMHRNPTTCSNPDSKVIILRGLPGSGKSHLSKNCSENNVLVVCSADDFFSKSGSYEFNPDLIPEAHLHCMEQFLQAVLDGTGVIVIDNTNSMLWEYRNYVSLCELFAIRYHILEIPHHNRQVVEAYLARNLHRVDSTSLKNFMERWEEDKRAMLVSPKLVYPRAGQPGGNSNTVSLLSLCQPGYLPTKLLESSSVLLPHYTGIFLTPKSQWKLVSSIPPTHPCVYADHITLLFEPSLDAIDGTDIGKKVTVLMKGLVDSCMVQAATVDLPKCLGNISSQNMYPHITISTDESSAPKFVNAVFETQRATPLADQIKLSGVIGIVVREEGEAKPEHLTSEKFHTILSKKHFNSVVRPRLHQSTAVAPTMVPTALDDQFLTPAKFPVEAIAESPETTGSLPPTVSTQIHGAKLETAEKYVSICSGLQKVTDLYVFDFDGTLFDTPDPGTGRQYYEKCTGQRWPHRGWLRFPESLLPPLKIKPGPSLVDYRRHCGKAGSFTAVLTARVTRTESAVRTILENHQVYPQLLILKPEEPRQDTPDFKVDSLASLLKQFPDVELVKFWDDREENLEAVRRFSKRHRNRKIEFEINNPTTTPQEIPKCFDSSVLGSYLAVHGLLPTEQHVAAARTGIEFIAAQFCAVVGFKGDPSAITRIFGSHVLGRMGDVDLCLLAPPPLTHIDCIEKLAEQLEKCGVTHLHKGYSTRCPRLKVLLQFKDTPSIDYDVIFAILSSSGAFSAHATSSAEAIDAEKLLSSSDGVSKTALSGYTLLCKVQETIRGFVPPEKFGAVVEMTVQILRAQRKKGNYYHYIRTFHIVLLLTDFVKKNLGTKNPDSDSLFEQFIANTAQLSSHEWQKVFEDYVQISPEFVPRFCDVFKKLAQVMRQKDLSLTTRYEDMILRPVFPPTGYTPVRLACSAGDHVIKWRLRTLLEAKLPTFIQHLLSSGLDVVLDGNGVQDSFCFAVQETESTEKIVQLVFRKFWNEFSEYRNRKDIELEVVFSRILEPETEDSSEITKLVEQFAASDEKTELHLPVSLSAYERLLAHETAERLGLNHKTLSSSGKKHIFLYK